MFIFKKIVRQPFLFLFLLDLTMHALGEYHHSGIKDKSKNNTDEQFFTRRH